MCPENRPKSLFSASASSRLLFPLRYCTIKQRSAVRFEFPVRPVATRDELDQAFPSAASRDFLGAWLVPKCVEFRGGAIWKVEIAALRGWARSHARCAPAAPASLTGHSTEPSPCTHNTSRATPRLGNLSRQFSSYAIWPRTDVLRSPKFDCNIPSSLRPVCFPVRSRTHDQFGLTVAHTGARGINHPASSLADVLEVLLRAGFVASAPGTPELCFSKYTLQCALRAKSAALESPKSMAIYP